MSLADDDPRPPYVQVADELRRSIDTGALEPGRRIRSIRELSQEFGVAQMTITNALRLLRDEGRIETTPNRGSFVTQAQPAPKDDLGSLAEEVRSLREDYQRLADRLQALEDRA